jgi:hypothetical protein
MNTIIPEEHEWSSALTQTTYNHLDGRSELQMPTNTAYTLVCDVNQ